MLIFYSFAFHFYASRLTDDTHLYCQIFRYQKCHVLSAIQLNSLYENSVNIIIEKKTEQRELHYLCSKGNGFRDIERLGKKEKSRLLLAL